MTPTLEAIKKLKEESKQDQADDGHFTVHVLHYYIDSAISLTLKAAKEQMKLGLYGAEKIQALMLLDSLSQQLSGKV